METSGIKDIITDSLRFWEVRRIAYNLILSLVVIFGFWINADRYPIDVERLTVLFVLAVIANLLYCSAYLPDLLIQMSAYRDTWRKYRFGLFAIGTLFAAVLAAALLGLLS
jgi:hypothetical protein